MAGSLPLGTSGQTVPRIGLGTWKSDPGQVGVAVRAALEIGYRHIDCAAVYGNEQEIGAVLKDAISSGMVKREELFVTSKLWNSEHRPENVEPALRQTLADLQLDYLDLYLVHWPQAFEKVPGTHIGFPRNPDQSIKYDLEAGVEPCWRALEKCVDAGLVRALGVSNFNAAQLKDLVQCARVKPVMLQCESHPYFSNERLFSLARSLGLQCTAYSPLGSGSEVGGVGVPSNPVLVKIGEKHGKSAAQVACAWQLQRGNAVIPKSVTKERIAQNFDIVFTLSEEDMAAIAALDCNARAGWGGPLVERGGQMRPRDELHPLYPFKDGIDF
eukprot:TRINITY_DN13655_c0_g1_i1.p1 TRINITY_DN13655_c0_g1~~TRINITY_DN13655_c0_g1_i1.p1  ORF type:complete len:351 (+),score=106.68 TRINITY_DN13655_c0_g1_i1:72-1055(+)